MALPAFDSTIIEYIERPKNVVADALSRSVPADEKDHSAVHLATMHHDRPEPVITKPVAVTAPASSTKSPPQHWRLTHDNQWIREPIPPKSEPLTEAPLSRCIRERQVVSTALKHQTRPTSNFIINSEIQRGLAPHERRTMRDHRRLDLPPEIRELLTRYRTLQEDTTEWIECYKC